MSLCSYCLDSHVVPPRHHRPAPVYRATGGILLLPCIVALHWVEHALIQTDFQWLSVLKQLPELLVLSQTAEK